MFIFFYAATLFLLFFFFNDTATTEIYTLSLHDALPIWPAFPWWPAAARRTAWGSTLATRRKRRPTSRPLSIGTVSSLISRSEEHTSELQSQSNLVCRLLLEKKKKLQTGRQRPGTISTMY